ncbi:hypothetical protein [Sodalis-like endosymbiont of Proechinophthirus fluctus]|nr:hypothetical protein [Sodalis-like endosymbiont of Proechinophthirus fluctus]
MGQSEISPERAKRTLTLMASSGADANQTGKMTAVSIVSSSNTGS